MIRFTTLAFLAVLAGLLGGIWLPTPASAQVVYSYYPPVVTYSSPAPVTYVQPAQAIVPSVSYYAPAPVQSTVTYYTPVAPAQPTVTYYQPSAVAYSYYPPPVTTVYSAPAPVYAPTTFVTPGTVTTRTYLGLGIFRPFGVNRETWVTPGSRTTYYSPVYP